MGHCHWFRAWSPTAGADECAVLAHQLGAPESARSWHGWYWRSWRSRSATIACNPEPRVATGAVVELHGTPMDPARVRDAYGLLPGLRCTRFDWRSPLPAELTRSRLCEALSGRWYTSRFRALSDVVDYRRGAWTVYIGRSRYARRYVRLYGNDEGGVAEFVFLDYCAEGTARVFASGDGEGVGAIANGAFRLCGAFAAAWYLTTGSDAVALQPRGWYRSTRPAGELSSVVGWEVGVDPEEATCPTVHLP